MGLFSKKATPPSATLSALPLLTNATNLQLDDEDNEVRADGIAAGEIKPPFLELFAYTRDHLQGVVGEQHYAQQIYAALPSVTAEELAAWKRTATCELVPEPTNPHDPNAIAVLLHGQMAGYLPRADAANVVDLISGLSELGVDRIVGQAVIGMGANVDNGGPLFSVNFIMPTASWDTNWEVGPKSKWKNAH